MIRNHLTAFVTVSMLFLLVCSANQSEASMIFVTDLIDGSNNLPIPGNQAWEGQLGDDFTTTGITITSVGAFDDDGDGTVGSLTWRLYNVTSGALVHEEMIAATAQSAPVTPTIRDNYVWKTLASPLTLTPGTYSVVAYGFNGTDKNFNTNMSLSTLDVVFNTVYVTAAGGRYSGGTAQVLPNLGAGNTASTAPYNFGAGTFEYGAAIPEPTTFIIWSLLGGLGICVTSWRRR